MKFGVVVFPGSNCDHDIFHVLGDVLGQEVLPLWHKDTDLNQFDSGDCIILPGGFSFGDYLRCGAIASFSPLMQSVKAFADKGGYVLGICNGFQILCESRLLPGVLLRNKNQKFICKNIYLKSETQHSLITQSIPDDLVLQIPIAHAEGRYFAEDNTLQQLRDNDQILFTYCDANGDASDNANPNGASMHIAGICNAERNVFGMMPHPERASEVAMGNSDGLLLFKSILKQMEVAV
ncbi:MAG: phosphoribosylformylglycinamidine synthase subunit PurQ [Saprospiraceae bacterium]